MGIARDAGLSQVHTWLKTDGSHVPRAPRFTWQALRLKAVQGCYQGSASSERAVCHYAVNAFLVTAMYLIRHNTILPVCLLLFSRFFCWRILPFSVSVKWVCCIFHADLGQVTAWVFCPCGNGPVILFLIWWSHARWIIHSKWVKHPWPFRNVKALLRKWSHLCNWDFVGNEILLHSYQQAPCLKVPYEETMTGQKKYSLRRGDRRGRFRCCKRRTVHEFEWASPGKRKLGQLQEKKALVQVWIPDGRVQGRWRQPLLTGVQWWDKRHWAQTEIPFTHRKMVLIARMTKLQIRLPRGYGVSSYRDFQDLTGHGPEQPAVGDPCLGRRVGLDDLQRSLSHYSSHIPWVCDFCPIFSSAGRIC